MADATLRRQSFAAHALVAGLFCVLSILLTWPLAAHLTTHIPGATADDNVVFAWNFWWMRRAIAQPHDFFETSAIFFPSGVNLVLHTHTALNAWIGATVLGRLSPLAALNVTVLISAALNGFCSYLLAYQVAGRRVPAIVAGVLFATSASMTAQLGGHFNYYSAWCLPLFVAAFLAALRRRSWIGGVLAGGSLGLIGYVDYYYLVYSLVFAGVALSYRWLRPGVAWSPQRVTRTWIDYLLLAVALVGAAFATGITVGGGPNTGINLRAIATAAALAWWWRMRRPRLTLAPIAATAWRDAPIAIASFASAALCIAPLIASAVALWSAGDYTTQKYRWRSSAGGVDIAELVLGNPFGTVLSPVVGRLYDLFGLDRADGPAWLGVGGVIIALSWTTLRRRPEAGLWMCAAAVFFLWAIGPRLMIFGVNTGLPMPQILLRYVPIAANARIPTHAMVMLQLSVAMLAALALSYSAARRSRVQIAALCAVLAVDVCAVPIPLYRLDVPAIYADLASRPDGAVLELPLGIRDGFGEEGLIDPRVMFYQTVHGKPIAGGYISRLPPSVREQYRRSAVLNTLLELSSRQPSSATPGDPVAAVAELRAIGIKYVVVNSERLNVETGKYLTSLGLTLLTAAGSHRLYSTD